jgi:tRNA modification GTPase
VNPSDTIMAVASGPQRGVRAILRLAGPELPRLLGNAGPGRLLAEPIGFDRIARPSVQRASFLLDTSTPRRLDTSFPVLLLLYPSPSSYTGDHAAEILLPGNPNLVERVMGTLLTREGVRLATPGEFSARAYLNGRLTLAQAEGIAATIAARTDEELAAAESLLNGDTGRVFGAWADELAMSLALVEAGIDFTDQEDVVPITPEVLAHRLATLAHAIGDHLGSVRGSEHRDALATVALAGPPNAGKSTLFNALLGRRRAVVSPVAGTTRDVLAERLELGGDAPGADPVMLLDLAGLDATAGGVIDADAQERAREALAHADVVVHCDPTGRFDTPIRGPGGRAVIRARTKSDLSFPRHLDTSAPRHLPLCALDGTNLATLRRAIADAASLAPSGHATSASLLPRHRRALTLTLDHLRAALTLVQPRRHERALAAPELTAGALRSALDSLSELTGQVTPDDIIGRVFATFCVGK